jgi:hypothetical protein
MVNLTRRDIDLFKVLALGVANFKMILGLLNHAFNYGISETALLRRLSILHRAGYIATRKEPYRKRHGHFTIYALTKPAAQTLAELSYPNESIRMDLPAAYFVRHELNVSSVLHMIHRESSKGYYRYRFLDSSVLKQYRKKESRDPIPDLLVSLYFKNSTVEMNIEVDLGTVLIPKMARRIADQSETSDFILIMCNGEPRLQSLHEACSSSSYVKDNILLVLLRDFLKGGFRHTGLRTIQDETVRLKLDNEEPCDTVSE